MESGDVGNADTHSPEEPGHPTQRSRFQATITLYMDGEEAEVIVRSVSPEALDVPSRRVKVYLERVPEGVMLRVESRDLTALRAALNSFLRFIDASLSSVRVISRLLE